jgi:2-deoxy-D-gluconate 3-dehydrogenase
MPEDPIRALANRFALDGKTALVTGCSRGLGEAMARSLAEAGADIVGVSRSFEDDGSEIASHVRALGRRFRGYSCDLSDRVALYSFIESLKRDEPVIDILINNAGIIIREPAVAHIDATWDQVVETDLTSQFILARELGKEMLQRGSGKIVFTASLLTFQGGINVVSYAASKGAIGQVTKALANEWAGRGVNVNAVAPGYMRTDNTKALQSDLVRSSQIVERIPAGRWGEPSDLEGAVVFLASSASDYVHGVVLPVDGGWLGR